MVDLKVTVDSKEFKALMARMLAKSKNVKAYLKKCSIIMYQSFAENFKQQGRPEAWNPLSQLTIARRRKHSTRILEDIGRLRLSVMSKSADGNVYRLGDSELEMGTNLIYAAFQQWGTPPYVIQPKNGMFIKIPMPGGGFKVSKAVKHPGLVARPFVMIHSEDVDAMIKLAEQELMGI